MAEQQTKAKAANPGARELPCVLTVRNRRFILRRAVPSSNVWVYIPQGVDWEELCRYVAARIEAGSQLRVRQEEKKPESCDPG